MPGSLARELSVILAVVCFTSVPSFAQIATKKPVPLEAPVQLAGTWRGNSVCMVKDSPCRDEVNVYHIAAVAGKADTYSVTGSKIVEGREVEMGTTEWTYDPKRRLLESKTPAGEFRLTLQHDGSLEGGVLQQHPVAPSAAIPCDPMPCREPPDSELYYRRIHLTKVR